SGSTAPGFKNSQPSVLPSPINLWYLSPFQWENFATSTAGDHHGRISMDPKNRIPSRVGRRDFRLRGGFRPWTGAGGHAAPGPPQADEPGRTHGHRSDPGLKEAGEAFGGGLGDPSDYPGGDPALRSRHLAGGP